MPVPCLPRLLLLLMWTAAAHAAPVVFNDEDAFISATETQLEDFENTPWQPDTTFTGTVFAAGTGWSSASQLRASTFAQRSGAVSLSDVDAATADPLDRIEARFAGAFDAVGLAVRSAGRSDLVIELLDADAGVLAEHRQIVAADWVFLGWAQQGLGAHRLQVRALRDSSGFSDDFFIDDVRWGQLAPAGTAVPEPGALSLALAGLAALAAPGLRRRARRGRPARDRTRQTPSSTTESNKERHP